MKSYFLVTTNYQSFWSDAAGAFKSLLSDTKPVHFQLEGASALGRCDEERSSGCSTEKAAALSLGIRKDFMKQIV